MLSTETYTKNIVARIEPVVAALMEERDWFREKLNAQDVITELTRVIQKTLSPEEFAAIADDDLKERCSGIMSVEAFSGFLDDLSPEQLAIFDEAIQRT
ncbi:hypothetical protein [Lyngbya sp. CCY1209]|uniref:hypothetical protein n=1 Tax=Lyngbya sp. CCY1209 TaxID=2886103 RepID=UPI002D2096B8|nr:hypothetical protein [Lyngbya sp. CCY1209]MEB3882055.1 hypothetical protein [Lyngbya sp. CCY1209]